MDIKKVMQEQMPRFLKQSKEAQQLEMQKAVSYCLDNSQLAQKLIPLYKGDKISESAVYLMEYWLGQAKKETDIQNEPALSPAEESELKVLGIEEGIYLINKGVVKFADFFKSLVEDFGDAIRPYTKTFYTGVMGEVSDEIYKQMDNIDTVRAFDITVDIETITATQTTEQKQGMVILDYRPKEAHNPDDWGKEIILILYPMSKKHKETLEKDEEPMDLYPQKLTKDILEIAMEQSGLKPELGPKMWWEQIQRAVETIDQAGDVVLFEVVDGLGEKSQEEPPMTADSLEDAIRRMAASPVPPHWPAWY